MGSGTYMLQSGRIVLEGPAAQLSCTAQRSKPPIWAARLTRHLPQPIHKPSSRTW